MEEDNKLEFIFKGDIMRYGKVFYRGWKARTYAVSKAKAMSNFAYRFRLENGLPKTAKIEFSGKFSQIS